MMRKTFLSSDGVSLAYEDFTGTGKPTLVFCHGLAATGEQFTADAAFFAARGHRVLVPHLRGHGPSGAPEPIAPSGFSIDRLAADMLEMLDDAGAREVHWVGNSLGGIVALAMLEKGRFLSLATMGTTYAIKLPRIGGHRLISVGHSVLGTRNLAAITARMTSRHPAARALIEKMLHEVRPQIVATLAGVLTHYDLIAAGAATDIPILMLRGSTDGAVNAGLTETLRIMSARPNFRLVELDGGHCLNLDGPDAFRAALIAFWTSLAR